MQPTAAGAQQNSKLIRQTFILNTTVRTARVLPARTAVLKKVNSIHKQPHIKPSRSLYKSLHSKQEQRGPSSNKRVGAASPPPGSGSSGFARASCALWRARPCGLNQICELRKRKRFLSSQTSPTRGRYLPSRYNFYVYYTPWHKKALLIPTNGAI